MIFDHLQRFDIFIDEESITYIYSRSTEAAISYANEHFGAFAEVILFEDGMAVLD